MSTQTEFPLRETAQTVLMFLVNSLVSSKLIGFEYEDHIADHGDVVNAHIGDKKFHAPLIDWNTVSFLLSTDSKEKSFATLTNEYFEPCAVAMANQLDKNVLFWMAVRAGNRLGTPGAGFVMPDLEGQQLILSRKASDDLLKSDVKLTRHNKFDGSALGESNLSVNQIWVDDSCPDVTSDLGILRKEPDDIYHVYNREVIGDMNLMFSSNSARLACRPLPVIRNQEVSLLQEVVSFQGLSLRMTMERRGPDSEHKGVWDRVTCDMLSGVGVDPERTTVIYS